MVRKRKPGPRLCGAFFGPVPRTGTARDRPDEDFGRSVAVPPSRIWLVKLPAAIRAQTITVAALPDTDAGRRCWRAG